MDKGSNIEMVASSRKPNPFAQNDQLTSGRIIQQVEEKKEIQQVRTEQQQQVQNTSTMQALFANQSAPPQASHDSPKRQVTTKGLENEEAKVVIEAPILPPSS